MPVVRRSVAILLLVGALLAAAPAYAQVNLKVLHCWTEHRNEWVNEMLESFQQAYPGVTVTAELTQCGNVIQERFVTQVVAGTPPDVVMIHSLNIPGSVERGFLLPVDPYLERDGIALDTWYPSEIETARWEGRLYGLPMRTGGDTNSLLYYNRAAFAEGGVAGPPETWDEWLETARKLTRYDGDTLTRAGTAFYGGDHSEVAWLAAGGGSILSADARSVLFAGAESVEAVAFLKEAGDLIYYGGWRDLDAMLAQLDQSAYASAPRHALATGRLAMLPNGILEYSYLADAYPEADFAIAVRPAKVPGGPSGVNAGTFHWAIARGTSDPDMAWELVKWISLREETAGYFMLRQSRPSPVRAFNDNPLYYEQNPYWMIVGQALSRSVPVPMLPFTGEVLNLLAAAIGSAIYGSMDAGPALAQAAEQAQGIIDAYWRQ